MLSGVGPADHLREHGIAVVADSPGVGANLSDHPIVDGDLVDAEGPQPGRAGRPEEPAALAADPFRADDDQHRPGRRFRQERARACPHRTSSGTCCRCRSANGGLADPTDRGMSVLVTLVDVRSRGRISLRSADPRHRPLIDPAYLADPADLEALVRGVRDGQGDRRRRGRCARCGRPRLAPGADRAQRRGAAGLRPPRRDDDLPPGRHLRDERRVPAGREQAGRRRRHRAARQGRGRPARGRRLGDADRAARQHQRARRSRSPSGPPT